MGCDRIFRPFPFGRFDFQHRVRGKRQRKLRSGEIPESLRCARLVLCPWEMTPHLERACNAIFQGSLVELILPRAIPAREIFKFLASKNGHCVRVRVRIEKLDFALAHNAFMLNLMIITQLNAPSVSRCSICLNTSTTQSRLVQTKSLHVLGRLDAEQAFIILASLDPMDIFRSSKDCSADRPIELF